MNSDEDIDALVPDFGSGFDDGAPIPGWDAEAKPADAAPKRERSDKPEQAGPGSIRVPPHSTDAEQCVIGGLMLDNDRFADLSPISNRDFYHVQHQIIFDAIETLAATGKPFDAVTLSTVLRDTGRLEKAGGIAYLAEVLESTPSGRNVVAYAEIVAAKAQRRRVIARAGRVVEKAFGDDDGFVEALADLQATSVKRGTTLMVHSGADLRKMGAPIPWIWPGWLPEAMFTFLAGEKAMGKSTLAMAIAACLTTGRTPWSDRAGKPRSVMYWSGEDDVRIIVGRGEAAGVDFDRFKLVMGIAEGANERPFEPSVDMPKLLEHIAKEPPDVLVIDPLIRILKGKNSSAEDVRRSLDPIAAEAERLGIAIIGIGHFAKRSGDQKILDRFLGSQAWTARARMTWAIVKGGDEYLFGKPGTNITTERGVIPLTILEKVVKFVSGKSDKYTYTGFGEVNADETLDEVERRLVADHEDAERQSRQSEKYHADIQAASAWLWESPLEGYCTAQEWSQYCETQGWSTKSGQSKGRKIASMMGLKMVRRGAPGSQITYWHLPGVTIK